MLIPSPRSANPRDALPHQQIDLQAWKLTLEIMSFLLRTFRLWKVMFEATADRNPPQLKDASLALAMTTPPTMGMSVSSTGTGGMSPMNR